MSDRAFELAENLRAVEERISTAAKSAGRSRSDITLIAVTKFFPASDARILYDCGVRNFGENRDQEGVEKSSLLPPDSCWHFQGQVQGRKINSIISWARVIHSLDSQAHAQKFNRRLEEMGESRDFFLQVNLEPERLDRGGVSPSLVGKFLQEVKGLGALRIIGLMTVLPIEMDIEVGFTEVAALQRANGLSALSIGMSNDFEAAIRAGATHIRVGSSILGSRPPLA